MDVPWNPEVDNVEMMMVNEFRKTIVCRKMSNEAFSS